MLHKHAHKKTFNYAIIGAGAGGLTLAHRLSEDQDCTVTLFDPAFDRQNHIWGFWDKGETYLDMARKLSGGSWSKWEINHKSGTAVLQGRKYVYRALRSKDYETALLRDLKLRQNVMFQVTKVLEVVAEEEQRKLFLSNGLNLTFDAVFNTTPGKPSTPLFEQPLLQHFLGWQVSFEEPCFDATSIRLMDFRVSQDQGIHFMYLLPFSPTEALVESTVLSNRPLVENWYEGQLSDYLAKRFDADYKVRSTERGIIPMSKLTANWRNTAIGVGMGGGALRASSGYAFAQTLGQIDRLVASMRGRLSQPVVPAAADMTERWMDDVFLRVLNDCPKAAPGIFYAMGKKLEGDQFAGFMRGHAPWRTRLKLIGAVPKLPFLQKALG
ncbi:MAG: lycopene cyclase family protein [Parvibaculales bacterium]